MKIPTISVIVLAYNSSRTIKKCLESIINQNINSDLYEIIAVYTDSNDRTLEIIKQFPSIKIIYSSKLSIPFSRNLGVNKSQGKIIAFIDSDCIADINWLRLIYKKLNNKQNTAISGVLKNYIYNTNYISMYTGLIAEIYGSVAKLATNNSAYTKDIFDNVGLFNTKYITGEDVDFSWRIEKNKSKIYIDKTLVVYHQYRNSLFSFIKQQFNYGRGRAQLINNYKEKFSSIEKNITYFLILILFIYTTLLNVTTNANYYEKIYITIVIAIILLFNFTFLSRISILKKIKNKYGFKVLIMSLSLFIIIDICNLSGIYYQKIKYVYDFYNYNS